MIGIDTNVLLRWMLDDDPPQADLAAKVLTSGETVWISDIVLAETSWVLLRSYRLSRQELVDAFRSVLELPVIVFSDRSAIAAALDAYETGGPGLSDHLIGNLNAAAGCRTTLTFDKSAGKGPLFTQLT